MGDVVNFLMNPNLSSGDFCDLMLSYPHISPEEFLSDHNFLYETYGEYIKDWTEINDSLSNLKIGSYRIQICAIHIDTKARLSASFQTY